MEDNLKIYNDLRNVPKVAQKSFNNGRFSGTDINPMWRIKKLTEEFGACGFGWYYDIASREIITSPDGTMCAFVAVKLYVKQDGVWSMPIYGEGGNTFVTKTKNGYVQTSDEAYKMALTDAVSNATKQLGLGADIWFEKDVTKYTKPQPQATAPEAKIKPQATAPEAKIKPNEEQIKEIKAKVAKMRSIDKLKEYYKTLNKSFEMSALLPLFSAQKVTIQQDTTNA